MSLTLSLCTFHGIVMSGDRCITTTLNDGKSFCKTMFEQKLFVSSKGFAFSYAGDSTFKGKPASYWMRHFIKRFDRLDIGIEQYTKKLCLAFHSLNSEQNIILMGCGYEGGKPSVFSCTSSKLELADHLNSEGTCCTFAGENILAKQVIDAAPLAFGSFTLFDAIEFLQHVTRTVSNIQRFAQTPVTVSPDCDVLIITEDTVKWIVQPPSLL